MKPTTVPINVQMKFDLCSLQTVFSLLGGLMISCHRTSFAGLILCAPKRCRSMSSPRRRPQIQQSDRLDPLGLDFVKCPDAFGLGGQLLVDRVEALVPVPLVRFELALLFIVEVKKELRVAVLPRCLGD